MNSRDRAISLLRSMYGDDYADYARTVPVRLSYEDRPYTRMTATECSVHMLPYSTTMDWVHELAHAICWALNDWMKIDSIPNPEWEQLAERIALRPIAMIEAEGGHAASAWLSMIRDGALVSLARSDVWGGRIRLSEGFD